MIKLDRLNLQDGEDYPVRLYYAHRHGASPVLSLRTNIELVDQPDPQETTSSACD